MTLKEIEKIIDESDVFLFKDGDKKCFVPLNHQGAKDSEKGIVDHYIERGCSYIFYKHDDNGGIEKSWIVDHIDKKKKIVTKKLDEMTEEELKQVKTRVCSDRESCVDCPLNTDAGYCCNSFLFWKARYEENKDKEFDVEVEE